MIEINGKRYLTSKETAARYGYSYQWLKMRRMKKEPPSYIQIERKCRIYYEIEATDKWFRSFIKNF